MATSSILTNVIIRDLKKAEALANALETSSRDTKRRPLAQIIPVLRDAEEIREFLEEKV